MQIKNITSQSFNGHLFVGGKLRTSFPTTPEQDKLLKSATDYFLDGKRKRKLDKDSSSNFSGLLNKIIGKDVFTNDKAKSISKATENGYVYEDIDKYPKCDEFLVLKLDDN